MSQVDFANKKVGGGILSRGCVQEEIRFAICPEMIVSRLFTEELNDTEALVMIGCEQFSQYSGYSVNFQFSGDFIDETPHDRFRRRYSRVIAIDAKPYSYEMEQFAERNFRRELNKALSGFLSGSEEEGSPIASGLWGCGVFNGHSVRSAIIQFMACVIAKRNLVLYTNGDEEIRNQVGEIFSLLSEKNVSIKNMYRVMKKFYETTRSSDPTEFGPFVVSEIEKDSQSFISTLKEILSPDKKN